MRAKVLNSSLITFPKQIKVAGVIYDLYKVEKGSNPQGKYQASAKKLPKGAQRFIQRNVWKARDVAFPKLSA